MILSEYGRRWAEVRFYQFLVETYELRHKSIDIVNIADTICELGDANPNRIRALMNTMLNDTYYRPSKREIILLGKKEGMSTLQIADYMKTSRQAIAQYIKRNDDIFSPLPRCQIDDDYEIVKFLQTLEKIHGIGTLGHGTIN